MAFESGSKENRNSAYRQYQNLVKTLFGMALTLAFIGFEVDEFSGSEGGVGYQWLRAASSVCDQVTVFTRADLSGPSLVSITQLPNVTAVLIPPPLIIAKDKKYETIFLGPFKSNKYPKGI